jgi:hypothetical protein
MSAVEVILRFACPHCATPTEVSKNEVNCAIFRCGVWKSPHPAAGQPINPHMPQLECEAVREQVFGCTKPFRLVDRGGGNLWVEICGYI